MRFFEIARIPQGDLTEESPDLRKPFFKEVSVDGFDLIAKSTGNNNLSISAYTDNKTVGTAQFWKSGKSLFSEKTSVSPEFQRQGIATLMYQFVKSLGFNIKPSKEKTIGGQQLWKSLDNKGSLSKKAIDDTGIMEIARIPQGDYGSAGTIDADRVPDVARKELPGGSGFTYGINQKDTEFLEIMIFDQDQIVGELDLSDTRGPMKTWSVENIAVDPQHRGRGIAKALYGIALSILKLPVEAGQLQTGHGQKMWLMLNSIPGVEVVGSAMDRTSDYRPRPGDDIVLQDKNYTHYTFPVRAGTRSMRSSRPGTGIYTRPDTTMVAKWTGQ